MAINLLAQLGIGTVISTARIIGGAIIGVYVCVGKHTSNIKKHPCSDNLVFTDVCEKEQEKNSLEHQHLKEGIVAAIARSDEQHIELKQDVKDGFARMESLIKNGG